MNFLNGIEKYNNNICLFDGNKKKLFYKDILGFAKRINKNLEERNLIFVLAYNNIEFIKSYISFFRRGLIQMLIDPNISNDLLRDLIKEYLPNYIFLPSIKKIKLKDYDVILKLEDHNIFKKRKKKII